MKLDFKSDRIVRQVSHAYFTPPICICTCDSPNMGVSNCVGTYFVQKKKGFPISPGYTFSNTIAISNIVTRDHTPRTSVHTHCSAPHPLSRKKIKIRCKYHMGIITSQSLRNALPDLPGQSQPLHKQIVRPTL